MRVNMDFYGVIFVIIVLGMFFIGMGFIKCDMLFGLFFMWVGVICMLVIISYCIYIVIYY